MLSFLKKHSVAILVFLLTTSLSLLVLLQSGVLETHDGIFHSIRAVKMLEELRAGQFPVRWVFSLDNGYGLPLFNYVYPGPYYLTAIPQMLGISNITSLKLLTLTSYFLGGFGLYLLGLKSGLSRFISTLIGLIYLFVPYQFVNIFVRGSIGETMVMGLAPWALLSLSSQRLRWYSPLPLALALLSHNFLGLLLTGMLTIYTLTTPARLRSLASIILSLLLAAFFLLPMIIESPHLLSSTLSNFSFLWSEHLVYPMQFLSSPWGYLFSRPGVVEDGMTFQLGYGTLLILAFSLTQLKNYFWTIILLGSIYLMTPYSHWIWDSLPILSVMQFPWRLLGITTIVTGFLLTRLVSNTKLSTRLIQATLLLTLALSIYNTWGFHTPRSIYDAGEFDREYNHYQNLTTTSYRGEVVPRWAHTERYQSTSPYLVTDSFGLSTGPAELTLVRDEPGSLAFQADAENDSAVAIYYHNYFPGWRATLDGDSIDIRPSDTGEILIPLASGVHNYTLMLRNTLTQSLSNTLSLLTILFLGIMEWKRKQ